MEDPAQPALARANVDFLAGGQEMEKVIRAKDWSKTPLGPIEGWPQSLRTTVSLCLASNFPISIAWGPGRVQIYNDGYWPICAAKHPHSMGQDFKECWFSAWPAIGEAFDRAQRGQTSFLENQRMFLDRNGYLEETFFTFSFSPIRDETGGVGGLFHPVTETTSKMLAERRTRALRDLGERGVKAKSVDQACLTVAQVLKSYALDLPFGLLYQLREGAEEVQLAGCFGMDPSTPASPEFLPIANGADGAWPIGAALRTGTPLLVDRIDELFGKLSCGPYPEPLRKAFVLPIPGLGLQRWAGVLIAGVSTRLPLDDAYRTFYDLLAGHISSALANARSYEEERRKAEALAELDRAKTAFFSNVSHEFRTPLTLILAPLEHLLQRGGQENDELAQMHRNALRLLKLVNTLLDFSRIEAGRVQAVYEPVDLSHLTVDLASAFRSAVERAGLELVVDCPPLGEPVFVDREMWEKIVLNLVSNAFKFTFEGRIEVRLHLAGDHVELEVQDTGTGIAAEELPRVFDRFHRIQGAQARTHEGTGIGLALVQELVRLHGGTISMESEVGRGTRFAIQIPRGRGHLPANRIQTQLAAESSAIGAQAFVDEAERWLPDPPAHASPVEVTIEPFDRDEPEPTVAAGGRILLADDNADMRSYLRRILAQHYDVHAVPDGMEALEFARSHPVDLILTDVMMPRMDGFALLHALRQDSRSRSIPIILLSARAGEESRVEGLDAGADDYLIKPFTVRELLARVDSHLRMARLRRESAALQESELRFRTMADCAPVMLWTCGGDLACDYFNKGWLEFTGCSLREQIAGGWTAKVHPDDAARVFAQVEAAAGKRTGVELGFRLLRDDDQYRWVEGSLAVRQARAGQFFGFVFSCIDIDDRKRTQEALEESRQQLRLALDAAKSGMFDWNLTTGDGYYGPGFHRILEYPADHLPRRYEAWSGLLHPEERADVLARIARQVELGDGAFTMECRLRRQSGDYTWVETRGKVITRSAQGAPERVIGTVTDVTARRSLEEQLRQSQRLESVGHLAGGVAHDFNNLLTVINGYAEMAAADLPAGDPLHEYLQEIHAAGGRAADLTRQLLAFSRKQILQPAVVNLNSIVTDLTKMLRRLIGENIALTLKLGPDLNNITADPGQLEQIIMNLVVNARDAMPAGGSLRIETANIDFDSSYASTHPTLKPGVHVMLAITDTGSGMTREVQEHIFEPFYTTKPKGQGTGLGLATVYGIVKQMGGWIWVYSEPDLGTTFKLYFQTTHESPTAERRAPEVDLTGSESILVVEDQEEVRSLTVRSLKKYGYTVFSAAHAGEAITFCERHRGPLDLVLTDVVMPGLDGRKLADRLIRLRPELCVLFMSGYTDDAIAFHGVLEEGLEYLQKPFTPQGLAHRVRQVLGKR